MLRINLLFLFLAVLILTAGCGSDLPEIKSINKSYSLIDQDSSVFNFPDDFVGKVVVAGYIFINCPDICPMTIHNMQLIQQKAEAEGIKNIEFAAISFDPERDTPAILKQTAEIRSINTENFHFLTGRKSEIDSLLSSVGVYAFVEDTTYTESGDPVYFFVHTDRISLIDQNGVIRGEYGGSKANIDLIISDIKKIED